MRGVGVVILVVIAFLFFLAARLWWLKIATFNRRIFGAPRNGFQRRGETVNRVARAVFLGVCGGLVLVSGLMNLVR